MNQELDYAEMLEIPVSTVTVVKKKGLFKRKNPPKDLHDDLKEQVVDSVNERMGAFVYAEDLSDPPAPAKKSKKREAAAANAVASKSDKGSAVIIFELIAAGLIAVGIFLTNVFVPNTAINTFISSFKKEPKPVEPTYSEIQLSSVVGAFSDADVTMTDNGVITFTAKSSVYPVCGGTVASITRENELYTVEIAHTSTFSSVITGLSDVYSAKGTKVAANIPFAYSDGENEVRISMYDNGVLLNCYTLSGEVPVWNS